MNEVLKRVLFGEQKQANRQVIAITNAVHDYLVGCSSGYKLVTEKGVVNAILEEFTFLQESVLEDKELLRMDKFFISATFGRKVLRYVMDKVPCKPCQTHIGDKGKILFYVDKAKSMKESPSTHTIVKEAELIRSEAFRKGEGQEEKAYKIAQEILSKCPNRKELPEDDVLAAVVYSEQYWRNQA